ncbi:MAG: type 4a pilus biogenesis protein PilO [Desulfobacteraceae bacterium]|nr:type 4a pilus biogenesis protein PilO [Desulfobacteraceae bacterium]
MAIDSEKNKTNEIQEKIASFFDKVGGLSKAQRLIICIVTIVVVGGGYYYFIFMPKNKELNAVRGEHKIQITKLKSFKIKARELKDYEIKMAKVQENFDIAMEALPEKKELPSLLRGVSEAGSDAGLVFILFQPAPVIDKEFYKIIPLSMKVEGDFHQIADFFSRVATLNRIVNINNISMITDKKDPRLIQMDCSAVTYMFADPGAGKTKKKTKGKKKG